MLVRFPFNRICTAYFASISCLIGLSFCNSANAEVATENNISDLIISLDNNLNKSSSQLIGGWSQETTLDSGEKVKYIAFFQANNSWTLFVRRVSGVWYEVNQGTWELSDNILYQTDSSGKEYKGALNFTSENEYVFKSYTSEAQGIWQRLNPKGNLSKEQLVGTWSLKDMNWTNGGFYESLSLRNQSSIKLLELNSDGTFRYKNTDGSFATTGITTSRNHGIWEYVDNGFEDGMLLLKNTQGQLFSRGSINLNDDGSFFYIHRAELDRQTNKLSGGKIERFSRSELKID